MATFFFIPVSGAGAAEHPKNLIVMIADGAGSQQYAFARWWKGEPLHIEKHLVGSVRTFIADSVIANSASAVTAFATGVRTNGPLIGVGPRDKDLLPGESVYDGADYHPVASVLEGARLLGKSTGLVATVQMSHATPAGYYAHTSNRGREEDIMEMGVYANIDVMFGGGGRLLVSPEKNGGRRDGENLEKVLTERGYALVGTADEMRRIDSGRVWGIFAASYMEPEVDRADIAPEQPSLAEMTEKALALLSQNEAGFFLMVEGSQIDWANHANDPVYMIHELMAWDDACGKVLEFAKEHGDTLVLMLSDHDTGGFSIGNSRTNSNYSQIDPSKLINPVRKAKMSTTRMAELLGSSRKVSDVQAIARKGWGVDLSRADARGLLKRISAYDGNVKWAFGEVLSAKYTRIGWATHGHTGADVPLGAYGVGKPSGMYDGPGIGRLCAEAFGLDMEKLTARLFVDAEKALPESRVSVKAIPGEGDRKVGYSLLVDSNGRQVEFPANKNTAIIDGEATELEGLSVYVEPTRTFYIPIQAVNLVTGTSSPLPEFGK